MYPTQQMNSALPVDPYHPHQWAFNPQLPNQVPFIPPVSIGQQIQPYLQIIAGQALLEAQNNAGKNPLRTFFFNMLSMQGFQNSLYTELVQSAAELTEYLVAAKRMDINAASMEAAKVMNSVQAAMQMEAWPALKQMLEPNVVTGSIQWLQHFQGVAKEIMAWRTPAAPMYGNGQQFPHQPNQPYAGNPNAAYTTSAFWDTSRPSGVVAGAGTFMGGIGSKTGVEHTPQYTEELRSVDMLADRPKPTFERSVHVTSFGNPQTDAPVTQHQTTNNDAPPMSARPFDGERVTEKGYVVIPASQSNWDVTSKDHKPYRMAYNPETHCLFHGKSPTDGSVEEVLVSWSDSEPMSYLKNELRSDLRAAIPADPHAARIVPNYELLTHMSPVTDTMLAYDPQVDEQSQDIPEIDPVIQTEINFASSLSVLLTSGALERELIKDEGEEEMVAAAEIYGDVTRALMCEDSDIVWLLSAARCKSISELAGLIGEARSHVNSKVLDEVCMRVTDELNRGLKYNLQLDGVFVDDAIVDYNDLMEMLEGRHPGGTLVNLIQSHEPELLNRALHVLTGSRLTKFLTDLHGEASVEKLSRKILVFTDRVGVTYVDWSSQDMDVAFVESGALSQISMPNLYRAVKAMYARTSSSDRPFAHHLMRTNDGVLLEFHEGWLGKGYFLISKMVL